MNVLIVSQCSKNALVETRRILDQFAERKGDRTWQTAITMQGLETLRRMLRKKARRNTAVACHWIRGRNHSELMWIVGDASQFNSEGAVPTNITSRDILRTNDENTWHTAEAISLLAGIAGLFHDFGKANQLFQDKLKPGYKGQKFEPMRHEWISLRLFCAFVGDSSDQKWIERLHHMSPEMESDIFDRLEQDHPSRLRNPFKQFEGKPLAMSVAWLLVTHHRLPQFFGKDEDSPRMGNMDRWLMGKQFNASWNSPQAIAGEWDEKTIQQLWAFPLHTPLASREWCRKAQSLGKRAVACQYLMQKDWLQDRFSIHLARLTLILADHCYSAADPTLKWQDQSYNAYANTDKYTGQLRQKLDEHNVGVGHTAVIFAKRLPGLRNTLPAISRVNELKRRVTVPRFRWQDRAYDLAKSISRKTETQGFFGVNMASTGCGKTFGNARIMYGLANEQLGCRFNVALGLRTLTLQTGDALRDKLHLSSDDLATLVGSVAVRQLHEYRSNQENQADSAYEQYGSESAEDVLSDGLHIRYEGSLDDGYLRKWLEQSPNLHRLVSAPVLVSTIDYLMPATEGARGGKQIAPMLRLLTSDLVLDEPDDFGLEDLPALCRLVNWAGMLGTRVLLSSATLPPALIQALFEAYLSGREEYQKVCGEPGVPLSIPCAWFDEFGVHVEELSDSQGLSSVHANFVNKRIQRLQKERENLRHAHLLSVKTASIKNEDVVSSVANTLYEHIIKLHKAHHNVRPSDNKLISIGLVRMANINPLVAVAKMVLRHAMPENHRIHYCIYHSQYPLLMRSHMEQVLDSMLNRNQPEALWLHPTVQHVLATYPEDNHLFVVFGTSVTEVGRDHDYDWAIAEPSSMRSLIQLAGRIQRHRRNSPSTPNLLILSKNINALQGKATAYERPGFESKEFQLASKDLHEILRPEQYEFISAIPRIQPSASLQPLHNLVDLEHTHLQAKLFGSPVMPINASLWWKHNPTWCAEFQRRTPFRKSEPDETYALYQVDEHENPEFHLLVPQKPPLPQSWRFKRHEIVFGERVSPWVSLEPSHLFAELADREEKDVSNISLRFGLLQLPDRDEWCFHPQFGVFGDFV